ERAGLRGVERESAVGGGRPIRVRTDRRVRDAGGGDDLPGRGRPRVVEVQPGAINRPASRRVARGDRVGRSRDRVGHDRRRGGGCRGDGCSGDGRGGGGRRGDGGRGRDGGRGAGRRGGVVSEGGSRQRAQRAAHDQGSRNRVDGTGDHGHSFPA